ncbi:MAG: peptide/nickel transport system substrate-binding protein [Frankiaceae bacterium]|nr:peptide/nickel transport system substrate-binding protein [Frankiaceae bacterium]
MATAAALAAASACTPIPLPAATPSFSGVPATAPATSSEPAPTPTPTSISPTTAPTPVAGGTLHLAGGRDDGLFDTASNSGPTANLLRGLSRQLVSYRSGRQFSDVVRTVVADAAEEVPLPIDGTTYTFHIRDGVSWDLPIPRPVTSTDFARGIKRLCNPVDPAYQATYFSQTIAGMAAFCDGLRALGAKVTAKALRSYLESHNPDGLRTPDEHTLVVTLTASAGDFLNMMALSAASALPIESLAYLPGSDAARRHFVSDGPYRVASYVAGRSLRLIRNPVWSAAADPIRKAYADEVQVDFGTTAGGTGSGVADFSLGPLPPDARPVDPLDPLVESVTNGAISYVVVNMHSTSQHVALRDLAVRAALAAAVDKSAIVDVVGGPDVAQPLGTVLPPQILGFRPGPGADQGAGGVPVTGDPLLARAELAAAGHAQGIGLKLAYADDGANGRVAQVLERAWKAAGISVTLTAVAPADVRALTTDPARQSAWDLLLPVAWRPDWYPNGARTLFVPLLSRAGGANYGGFDDPAVESLIARALAEPDANKSADIWAQADRTATAAIPEVPLFTGRSFFVRSSRVQNWQWDASALPDWTNVWLAPAF